jgi:hypothetical protein
MILPVKGNYIPIEKIVYANIRFWLDVIGHRPAGKVFNLSHRRRGDYRYEGDETPARGEGKYTEEQKMPVNERDRWKPGTH